MFLFVNTLRGDENKKGLKWQGEIIDRVKVVSFGSMCNLLEWTGVTFRDYAVKECLKNQDNLSLKNCVWITESIEKEPAEDLIQKKWIINILQRP